MRLRFTIRDLLWLTALAAISIYGFFNRERFSHSAGDAGFLLVLEWTPIVAAVCLLGRVFWWFMCVALSALVLYFIGYAYFNISHMGSVVN